MAGRRLPARSPSMEKKTPSVSGHGHSHGGAHRLGKSGSMHRQSHDVFLLEDWLDATRRTSVRSHATVRQRARVHDMCARELFHQTAVGSPKIANLLERVWAERTALFFETLEVLEHQTQIRDHAQTELMNVARNAGLHAERTKRVGNQWEVQRAGVLENMRGTQAELHSMTVERNQLKKEVRQLRGIIDDYVNGVPMSKKKQLLKAQNEGRGIGEGVIDMQEVVSAAKFGNDSRGGRSIVAEDLVECDSDEEDLTDLIVKNRIQSVRQADRKIDALLLELMSEKRVQKAAIRGSKKLVDRFLSGQTALALGVRKH
jgi:hypothetical protein